MKRVIILTSLIATALLLAQTSVAIYDYVGVNEKYSGPMESSYKFFVSHNVPEIGLLEVSCFFFEDRVSISSTIDNVTIPSMMDAVIAGALAYRSHYNKNGWPEKADITIKIPKGTSGQPVCSGVVYAKWIDEYEKNKEIDETGAWNTLMLKIGGAIQFYTP